jgi:RHS repeat-associated protein
VADTQRYGFTGREYDLTTLQHNRNRYYYSAWGQFISEDPTGLEGGINLYAYVGNDPIDFIDPLGTGPLGAAIGGVIGGDFGADLGGLAGAAGGSLAGPGGTVAGGVAGADMGGLIGSRVGASAGSAIEDTIGNILNSQAPAGDFYGSLKPCQGKVKTNGSSGKKRRYTKALKW